MQWNFPRELKYHFEHRKNSRTTTIFGEFQLTNCSICNFLLCMSYKKWSLKQRVVLIFVISIKILTLLNIKAGEVPSRTNLEKIINNGPLK